MKTSTLFVVGLLVGALLVFGFRAVNLGDGGGDSDADGGGSAGGDSAGGASTHAGHSGDTTSTPKPMPIPEGGPEPAAGTKPAPAPAPVPEDAGGHAGHDMGGPENQLCPVMGNEVDPEVFVDYKGRRIGFCCPGCDTLFLKNPAKYLKKVDAELAARKEPK